MTKFFVNGEAVDFRGAPDTPLLWVLRDNLALTGTKFGCGMAQCGACTVHVDGEPTGIAVHESFGSACAQVAEVSLEGNNVRVHRVVAAATGPRAWVSRARRPSRPRSPTRFSR